MVPVLEKTMTWRGFREMEIPDYEQHFTFELIDGMIVKRGAPSIPHQKAVIRMASLLLQHVDKHQMGLVLPAPMDVFFDDGNGFQPDICFVSKDRSFLLDNGQYINGAPDLVVEVLSPGTGKNDRMTKKDVYERYAVKEYWIIDPIYHMVEVYSMRNNALQLIAAQEGTGKIESVLLPGFEVQIETLFE